VIRLERELSARFIEVRALAEGGAAVVLREV